MKTSIFIHCEIAYNDICSRTFPQNRGKLDMNHFALTAHDFRDRTTENHEKCCSLLKHHTTHQQHKRNKPKAFWVVLCKLLEIF